MTSLTASDVTSLAAVMLDYTQQPAIYESLCDVSSTPVSGQFPATRTIDGLCSAATGGSLAPAAGLVSAGTATLPALSLAVELDHVTSALARLLIFPPNPSPSGVTTVPVAGDGVVTGHRRQRPVDRSASEPPPAAAFEGSAFCRYKTELCRPYQENGTCKYGEKCQFAHGLRELRPVVRHPKYKTDLCKTYHTTGLCPYGPRCHFIHNDDERYLNKLNRFIVEQQRALFIQRQQKEQLQAAAISLLCHQQQQLGAAVSDGRPCRVLTGRSSTLGSPVSRSPSPPLSAVRDDPAAAALAALERLVRQTAPQLNDSQVQVVLSQLLMSSLVADPTAANAHHPHQLQRQQHQSSTTVQSMLNSEGRLLAS